MVTLSAQDDRRGCKNRVHLCSIPSEFDQRNSHPLDGRPIAGAVYMAMLI